MVAVKRNLVSLEEPIRRPVRARFAFTGRELPFLHDRVAWVYEVNAFGLAVHFVAVEKEFRLREKPFKRIQLNI